MPTTKLQKEWETRRLRFSMRLNPSMNKDISLNDEVSFLPMEKVSEDGEVDNSEKRIVSEVKNGYTYFEDGDVILAKITPCFENGKGAYLEKLHNGVGFGSTEFIVLRPSDNMDGKFIYYLTFSDQFRKLGEVGMRGSAGQKRVSDNFVKDYLFANPPKPEQQKIADYLDEKVGKIEKIVFKKRQQIELLKEKRAASITHAVMRGLDPDVELIDSGVEWIGQVPKEWKVAPIYAYVRENKVKNINLKNSNVLSLSYGRIIRRDISNNFGLIPESFSTYQVVKPGLVVLRLTDLQNDKKSLRVGLVKEDGIITSAYVGLVFNWLADSRYMYYLLHSYDLNKVFYNLGAGVRQSLGYSELTHLPLLFPPKEIQEKIADYLDEQNKKIDIIIEKIEQSVQLLQEYKISLISSVVRGRIKIT